MCQKEEKCSAIMFLTVSNLSDDIPTLGEDEMIGDNQVAELCDLYIVLVEKDELNELCVGVLALCNDCLLDYFFLICHAVFTILNMCSINIT